METKTLTLPYVETPDWIKLYSTLPAHKIECRNDWPGTRDGVDVSFIPSYNDDGIQITFTTKGAPLICNHFVNQAAVCADSCVEFFIMTDVEGVYINFEFNILGYINASRRTGRHDSTPLTVEELAMIKTIPTYHADGPFVFDDLEDDTWIITVNIPWKLIGVKPDAGTILKGNFQACSDDANPPYYLTWSPIATPQPDYHRPEFFGDIILGPKE